MEFFSAKISISKNRISDLFCSACEGGSNYWCKEVENTDENDNDTYMGMIKGFTVIDSEQNNKKIKVTATDIKNAVQLFVVLKPARHFEAFMSENDDAETGDVFLQLCAFGKVIYG